MHCNHLPFFLTQASPPNELYVTLYNLLTTLHSTLFEHSGKNLENCSLPSGAIYWRMSQEVGILLSRLSWKLRLRHADKGHVVLWRRVNCDRTVCLAQRESEPTQTLLCARGGQPGLAILRRERERGHRSNHVDRLCAVMPRTTRIDPGQNCGLK